jgi:hypothetical protein
MARISSVRAERGANQQCGRAIRRALPRQGRGASAPVALSRPIDGTGRTVSLSIVPGEGERRGCRTKS